MRHPDDFKSFSHFILILIILNTVTVMLESVQSIRKEWGPWLHFFEVGSVVIFTLEYFWRIWSAAKRTRFIFSFFGLIDLLAILPFYLPALIAVDLRFVRILRLVRIFRIFKVGRYIKSMRMVGDVLREKKEVLFLTLFMTFLLLLVAASLMYEVENEAQPDKFPDIFSSFWWAVATLTTVGYGDVYPVTAMGKLLSGIIAILGIGLVALPTGIIGSGFIEILNRRKAKPARCPKCGEIFLSKNDNQDQEDDNNPV